MQPTSKPSKPKASMPKTDQHPEVMEALQAIGLAVVSATQVGAAVKELYPQGTSGVAESEVIRTVFLHFRRKN